MRVRVRAVGGDSFVDVDIYAEKISHKTVTAIAEALATATANHEECSASASSCAAVGSDNYACCDVSVDAYGKTRSVDAYAEAGARPCRPLTLLLCVALTRATLHASNLSQDTYFARHARKITTRACRRARGSLLLRG